MSVVLRGSPRPEASSPVDSTTQSSETDGSAAAWIGENSSSDLGFHMMIRMDPDRAEIEFECRVINRSLEAIHYNGGLFVEGAGAALQVPGGALFLSPGQASGWVFSSDQLGFAALGDGVIATRFDRLRSMAPRQVDTWTATLGAFHGIHEPKAYAHGISASFTPEGIELVSSRAAPGHKLVVLTESGETLEAVTDLDPRSNRSFPLDSQLGVRSMALLDAGRSELFRVSLSDRLETLPDHRDQTPQILEKYLEPSLTENPGDEFEWRNRALSETLAGLRGLAGGRFEEADRRFEQALLYNGEDHLTWWYKAMAKRLAGNDPSDMPELLNAHFLAPLEPALRAEAFLTQPISPNAEPNPLLSPFDRVPENFVEVACLLVEAGLYGEASRWIDEAIRHSDQPMLRYLSAYCHLVGSHLDAEAASQVLAGARLRAASKPPHRRVERVVLETLRERFPDLSHRPRDETV
jgi:tetratricopeptide (TPR) repeat protein